MPHQGEGDAPSPRLSPRGLRSTSRGRPCHAQRGLFTTSGAAGAEEQQPGAPTQLAAGGPSTPQRAPRPARLDSAGPPAAGRPPTHQCTRATHGAGRDAAHCASPRSPYNSVRARASLVRRPSPWAALVQRVLAAYQRRVSRPQSWWRAEGRAEGWPQPRFPWWEPWAWLLLFVSCRSFRLSFQLRPRRARQFRPRAEVFTSPFRGC